MARYTAGSSVLYLDTREGEFRMAAEGNRIDAMTDEQVLAMYREHCANGFERYFGFYVTLNMEERVAFDARMTALARKPHVPRFTRLVRTAGMVLRGRWSEAAVYWLETEELR